MSQQRFERAFRDHVPADIQKLIRTDAVVRTDWH